ncbi:peptidoglycan DD-metalloendopeptidase family protein [Paraliomyxa miuraensis]|uniref:peptidoglycan DD-metalloendopeptidase family protein n=1 Tax=Paraliomyxa miuraensis TaxID=376150 RepID=UPI00224D3CFE|nr:peptidoglycan DD-metalloendopeptidase family protein [Paraliomyxa miuraensis]MCX4247350.1 peptidoglycan DD-metalloendopeptidase family protein [Paraliomyxa miuraensis]
MLLASLLSLGGCSDIGERPEDAWDAELDEDADGEVDDDADEPGVDVDPIAITCQPTMHVFPVADAHNIGYDAASCGTGTCQISCPDAHANSDWGGDHHGIDVFAYHRAPLVAVTDGVIRRVGVVSATSGLRVRMKDDCGWEYYYGHLDEAVVSEGQHVEAGQLIGYMGKTGTASVHLHFNVSPDGDYSHDIDPFPLLKDTSPTACGGELPPEPPPVPPAPPPAGCGTMLVDEALYANEALTSCDGRFNLVMQGDGNLVLYQGSNALWHTQTHGQPGHVAVMQGDGNFVVYTPSQQPLWHAGTHGHPGAYLRLQDDGNLVIYDGATPLWWTKG